MRISFILMIIGFAFQINGQDQPDSVFSVQMDAIKFRVKRPYSNKVVSLSRSQFMTMAGALEDPTRLLIKYPGISTTNDQANSVVYHGLPSQYHKWALYGGRTLNPNHLGNAGTISDLPSRSAGGVNMLSGQVIGSLDFYGQPSAKSFDALSGSSDIKMRDVYRNGVSTNLSLIGMEAGIDKTFGDGSSGFLVNYRYSTVGLLTALGLDFGGESINYQDLTAKYSITKNDNTINAYLSLGDNYNYKDAIPKDSIIKEVKDGQDIDFDSQVILAGVNYQRKKGNRVFFSNTINVSHRSTDRLVEILEVPTSEYVNTEMMISLNQSYTKPSSRFINGIERNTIGYSLNAFVHSVELNHKATVGLMGEKSDYRYEGTSIHLIPTIDLGYGLPYDWNLKASIGFNGVFEDGSNITPIGSMAVLYDRKELRGKVAISRSAQAIEPEMRLYIPDNKMIASTNIETQVEYKGIGASAFYHRIDDLPFAMQGFGFSAIDQLDYLPISNAAIDLAEDGQADIYGASVFIYRTLGSFDFSSNLTVMKSKYKTDQTESDAPLDYGHIFNLTLAKKWVLKNYKVIGFSTSFHHRGGANQNIVNNNNSLPWGYTNYSGDNQYSIKLTDYYRADLRIYYKPSIRSTISLDIQNVTNRENDGYYFYEPVSGETTLKKQLGLIPILSWRVDW